jgi:hypothetical protein
MNIYRDSIRALLVASAIGYASLSMAGIADTEQSVRGDKAVYATDCKDADKRNGQCQEKMTLAEQQTKRNRNNAVSF